MAEEQKVVSDEVGLADVDSLLNELDPSFNSQLGLITTELGQIAPAAGLESISLSADYLKDSAEAKVEEEDILSAATPTSSIEIKDIPLDISFIEIATQLVWQTFKILPKLSKEIFILIKSMRGGDPLAIIKGAPEALHPVIVPWLTPFNGLIRKLKSYKRGAYIKLAIIAVVIVVLRFVLVDMKGHLMPDGEKDPFLKSWNEVSSAAKDLPNEDAENMENPLRHPEYTVLVHKIIANLKPMNKRGVPMVTSEIYIEASNQDCAVEIHERDTEVRDALARVFEEMTFDELDTKGGKERLKIKIRTSLNRFMTKGHIKRVFFSAFNIAP